jgi:hypothetical protein
MLNEPAFLCKASLASADRPKNNVEGIAIWPVFIQKTVETFMVSCHQAVPMRGIRLRLRDSNQEGSQVWHTPFRECSALGVLVCRVMTISADLKSGQFEME